MSFDIIFKPEVLIGSLAIGGGIAMAYYALSNEFNNLMDYIEKDFRIQLRRLRMNVKNLRSYLISWWMIVIMTLILVGVGLGWPILGAIISGLMIFLPWFLVRRAAEKRKEQIEDQLADAMVSLSSSIRAGLSLAQAMEILAKQSPDPIVQEFQQIYGEYQMGKTLERCLVEAKERLQSENFALFTAAMEASRKSGGRLNETVERIANSVRELQRLQRKLRSETAQARTSAVYMAMAPAFILFVYYVFVDQQNTERLFNTVVGQIILGISIILNITAYLWARAILSPEI